MQNWAWTSRQRSVKAYFSLYTRRDRLSWSDTEPGRCRIRHQLLGKEVQRHGAAGILSVWRHHQGVCDAGKVAAMAWFREVQPGPESGSPVLSIRSKRHGRSQTRRTAAGQAGLGSRGAMVVRLRRVEITAVLRRLSPRLGLSAGAVRHRGPEGGVPLHVQTHEETAILRWKPQGSRMTDSSCNRSRGEA